jgi:hypothetical protein
MQTHLFPQDLRALISKSHSKQNKGYFSCFPCRQSSDRIVNCFHMQISLWNCRSSKILPNHRPVQLCPAYYSRSGVVLKYSLVSTPGIQEKACPSFHTAPFSSFDLTSTSTTIQFFLGRHCAMAHFCFKCQINYSAFVSPLIYKIPCIIDTPKKWGGGGLTEKLSGQFLNLIVMSY